VSGRVDHLYGLKENVIVGRLIPAGTGTKHYHYFAVEPVKPEEMPETVVPEEEVADFQDALSQLLPPRTSGS
jgi:DNA-directed RNA polymerase subunit beta'